MEVLSSSLCRRVREVLTIGGGGGGVGGDGGVFCRYESAIVMFLPARADRSSDYDLQMNEERVEAAIASRRASE